MLHDTAIYAVPILCAVADRLRGWGGGPGKFISCMFYGMAMAYGFRMPPLWWPLLGFTWWVGALSGWGYPVGQIYHGIEEHARVYPNAKPERWQVWLGLENDPEISLIVRGLFWGLCGMIAVVPFTLAGGLLVTMAFWLYLVAEFDAFLYQKYGIRTNGNIEALRGLLMGLMALIGGRIV